MTTTPEISVAPALIASKGELEPARELDSTTLTAPIPIQNGHRRRRSAKGTTLNLTVMTLAAGLVATMALPAYAFEPDVTAAAAQVAPAAPEAQTLEVSSDAVASVVSRGGISATTREELEAARAAEQARLEAERKAAEAAAAEKAAAEKAAAEKAAAKKGTTQKSSSSSAAPAAASGSVVWPVSNPKVSSYFGPRASPCSGCSSMHKGVDFTPGAGTPVVAVADGVVKVARYEGSYGYWVLIEHTVGGQTVQSGYAHLQSGSISVSPGQKVSAGQRIAAVGNTGASTGPHLHFEIRLGGQQVDPLPWLRRNAG
ncbi:M23 family metallopeptidase [Herbiconiux sp. SYSU D00978]|uniref:M23 family metallopeptidase n=1 Tax=Herbiconiux sp. SYSU D00978 TaxID=2812562 RepID=UPI001A9760AC|nr:M23 family metallopeptidase [Herbiconiux sp. SYSU D00978]